MAEHAHGLKRAKWSSEDKSSPGDREEVLSGKGAEEGSQGKTGQSLSARKHAGSNELSKIKALGYSSSSSTVHCSALAGIFYWSVPIHS